MSLDKYIYIYNNLIKMKKRANLQPKITIRLGYTNNIQRGQESINFTKIEFDKLMKKHLKMPVSMFSL